MDHSFKFDLDTALTKDLADLTDRLYGPIAEYTSNVDWAKSILTHFNHLVRYWAFADLDAIEYFQDLLDELGSEHSRAAATPPLSRLISSNVRDYPYTMGAMGMIREEWGRFDKLEIGELYSSLDLTAGVGIVNLRIKNDKRPFSYTLRHAGSIKSFSWV